MAKKKNDDRNYVGYQLVLRLATNEVAKKLAIKPRLNVSHDFTFNFV